MIAIAFVSIWGAVHGRGPFTHPGPLVNVLSLQLFLFFTAAPFMTLAAVVEERQDAEQALRQRERELNEAQRLAQIGSWQWDPSSDAVTWSAELYRLAGYRPDRVPPSFKDHEQFFAPGSWDQLKQSMERALRTGAPYELDLEGIRPDGTKFWLTMRAEVVVDANGHPIYLRGTTQDITDRKLSEEALLTLSGRLITSQEEERIRIARELHDDLGQRMALLSARLEQFGGGKGVPDLASGAQQQLQDLIQVTQEVSSTIHNLSHELHPARLELLGLVASLTALCREHGKQHMLQVQFVHRDIPDRISKDVALCLYRIVQEALRNVVKHSGAAAAQVELSGYGDRIDLVVIDSGAGFNVESAKEGLGLISMRERLRSVGGQLSIESEPSHGTRIRVRIPHRPIIRAA